MKKTIMQSISFSKQGYDPFIDFLKAYSIFCVVFAHCLPVQLYDYSLFWFWGGMQVPMFVLIQGFHAYKKGVIPKLNLFKLIKRIVAPFVIVQVLLVVTLLLISSKPADVILLEMLKMGGKGPGAYFFWVYLQIALILPLLGRLIYTTNRNRQLILFLGISIGGEIFFSIFKIPDYIYRLIAIRYIFLIFLAYQIWINNKIEINVKTIFFSILSISAVYFFTYVNVDLEPFFYNTAWKNHRWICYFYVSTIMVYVLWFLYKETGKISWLKKMVLEIGKCSYEIYLMQMIVFVFISINRFVFIESYLLRLVVYMLFTIVLSIVLGISFKEYVIDRLLFRTKEIDR